MAERVPASRARPRAASGAINSAAERVPKPRTPPRSRSCTYQTPLRGNTSSSSSDDDDADARSWKSNGSRWGSDGSGVTGPSSSRLRETAAAVVGRRDSVDVKKRAMREPRRMRGTVYTTEEEVDEYGFRNEAFIKATLHRPPMTLAEENQALKEELEMFKQVSRFISMDCDIGLTSASNRIACFTLKGGCKNVTLVSLPTFGQRGAGLIILPAERARTYDC
jgi:hypothetical protein